MTKNKDKLYMIKNSHKRKEILLEMKWHFYKDGIDISLEELDHAVDGNGSWNSCSNLLTPNQKNKVSIASMHSTDTIDVIAHDFFLDKESTWRPPENKFSPYYKPEEKTQ